MTEAPDSQAEQNPFLKRWTGPFGAPPFDRIAADHVLPALEAGVARHVAEIEAIASDPAPVSFDNTVAAIERAGALLGQTRRTFWALASAQADAAIRAIEPEVSAILARHGSWFGQHQGLFERVQALASRSDLDLDEEQQRLLDEVVRGFRSGGAELDAEGRARLAAIDAELAQLSTRFGQNVLAAAAAWTMLLGADDLDGLPQPVRDAAAGRARARGHPEAYLFTLDRGDAEDLLAFSSRRDLRERMWRAFTGRCEGGEHDNRAVLARIVALRGERAALLGYSSYAAYKLEDSMAGTPEAAAGLLHRIWTPALKKAREEQATLQRTVDDEGAGLQIEPWDWRFYAERHRRARYALDAGAVREQLCLDAVREAAFRVAGHLFGLRFTACANVPVYHPDVQAWEVTGEDGTPVGLLLTDYFARPEKHGGAWMGSLRVQERLDGEVRPIVYTVANFARAPDPAESRLSLDEARTLFHEFGHALHALLSRVTYPSLAGTAVARDFVEFPSKFLENWIVAPELLAELGLPPDLIAAIGDADSFGQGFATVELVSSALVDLAVHQAPGADPFEVETATLAAIAMPPAIVMRHRLPHFTHIFDGGYAAAYYSYLWAEVLEADAFAAFRATGDIFDPALAARYRDEILARGNAQDPMASYVAFLGRPPAEAALLASRHIPI